MTTDLSSKTVEYLKDLILAHTHPKDAYRIPTAEAVDEFARRLEEAQQKIVAQEAKDNYVGRWLSAALDDPSVCEEMKADIRLWMASDAVALAAHDAKIVAEAKVEALDEVAREADKLNPESGRAVISFQTWIETKAAEYRAKAGRKE